MPSTLIKIPGERTYFVTVSKQLCLYYTGSHCRWRSPMSAAGPSPPASCNSQPTPQWLSHRAADAFGLTKEDQPHFSLAATAPALTLSLCVLYIYRFIMTISFLSRYILFRTSVLKDLKVFSLESTRNKCIATRSKGLTGSIKKLLETMFATRNKCIASTQEFLVSESVESVFVRQQRASRGLARTPRT